MKKTAILLLVLFIFCINSCKNNSDVINPTGKKNIISTENYGSVSGREVLNWFKNNPQYMPAPVLFSAASQAVINGQSIIRIPVATNAALYFTKVNGAIQVLAYKWTYTVAAAANYTGTIDVFNFQTTDFKRLVYNKGKITKVLLLSTGVPAKSAASSNGKLQTNSLATIFGQIWCYITGGTWITNSGDEGNYGSNGDINQTGCNYGASEDEPSDSAPVIIYEDESGEIFYDLLGGGGGGGTLWGPPPCPPGGDDPNNEGVKRKTVNSVNKKVNQQGPPVGGSGCLTAPDGSQWTPVSVIAYDIPFTEQSWLLNHMNYYYPLDDYIQNIGMSAQDANNFLTASVDYLMFDGSVSISDFITNYAPLINAVPALDSKPAINPQKYINCFGDLSGNDGATFTMTIYVNQPNPGHNDQWATSLSATSVGPIGVIFTGLGGQLLNVGHTFVGFTKHNTDGTSTTQVMGFYPSQTSTSLIPGVLSKGVIKDDSGHPYNVSYQANVTAVQFQTALSVVVYDSSYSTYALTKLQGSFQEYNCTDAASSWMNVLSTNIVPSSSPRGAFKNTPGDYGVALSQLSGASTTAGSAPSSHGPCN